MITLGIVLGLLAGTGLATGLVATVPAGRLDLVAALHHATRTAPGPAAGSGGAVVARLTALARRGQHPWFALPEADLDLLELAPEQYLARRLRAAALGLAAGAVLGVLGFVAEVLPAAVAVLCALAGAATGGMLPYVQVRDAAKQRRDAYRRVLAVYLDLVAQERSAGRAATPALREAAEVSDHPLLVRIRATVTRAHRLGHTPWDALRDLGTRLRVPELVDVADLADTAADGAAIATSLHTKATSLRQAALSDDTTTANARSEKLTIPVALLMLAFLGLLLYPTTAALLNS
ncbi:type II secretion system F family protein [Saccharopolyspora sp. SCSIO 74807]|uniref:type II secretion system F family protein n=1 Tax=Saccharopolyspora sp. SCSIO 74807 TaxID=3118084 RepID=UPI0030D0CF0A